MKKKATANLKDQKKPKKLEDDVEPTDTMPSDETNEAEHPTEAVVLPPAPANCEVATEQTHAPSNPRIERLLAKKAVRKARKAQEAAAVAKEEAEVIAANATVPCEAPLDVATTSEACAEVATMCTAEDSIVANEHTSEPNAVEEEPFPSKSHTQESDSGSTNTDEASRQMSGFRLRRHIGRWADDESGEEWELDEKERQHLLADLDEEERRRLLGEFPETTDDEGSDWDAAWSEDEEDEAIAVAQVSGVEPSVRPKADKALPTSRGQSRRRSRRSGGKRRRNRANKRRSNDNWMTPFSELFKDDAGLMPCPQPHLAPIGQMQPVLPTVNSIGPAVCIWNTTSSSATESHEHGNPQDVFTNGSQVFKSVPSTTGQPLFTDGKQLYASVCVMLGAPPSSDAGGDPLPRPAPEPSSMMDNSGSIEEHSVATLISYMASSDEED
eukprot:CAMPEP_0172664052 /NCGR_PEP_ID=MMETSP1074-20121228/6335_1 /TAXON_ID=2916 /ORGANISM="Ceratium fusus, Strain PA161109" /LENGTH=440 /DNA_ID=CAMNT_0013480135 /DNA_START=139 /DNA_END=1461 /DNA_ORIENTATION=-